MSKNMYAGAYIQDGVELLPDARKALRRLSYFAVDDRMARVTGMGFRPEIEADVAGFWAAVEDHLVQHKPTGLGREALQQVVQFAAHARRREVEERVAAQRSEPNAGPQRSYEVYEWTSGVLRAGDWAKGLSRDVDPLQCNVRLGTQPSGPDVLYFMGVNVLGLQGLHRDTLHTLGVLGQIAERFNPSETRRGASRPQDPGFRPTVDEDVLGALWAVQDLLGHDVTKKWHPDVVSQVSLIVDTALDEVDPRVHVNVDGLGWRVARALNIRDWAIVQFRLAPESGWFKTYDPETLRKYPILERATPLAPGETPPTIFGHVVPDEVANSALALTLLRRMFALATEDEAIHDEDGLDMQDDDDVCQSAFWNGVRMWCDHRVRSARTRLPEDLRGALTRIKDNIPEVSEYEWDDEQLAGCGPYAVVARFGEDRPFHWPAQTCVAVEITLRVYVVAEHCTKTTHKAVAKAVTEAVIESGLDVVEGYDDGDDGDGQSVFCVETTIPEAVPAHSGGRRVNVVGVSPQEGNIRARAVAYGDLSVPQDEARVSAAASVRSRSHR